MTAAELSPELRKLIDARLEAVDGVLTRAQIAWSERRSIVGEVETQIYELLSRRSPVPTREDVLAVLASLDPPESYIPEELRDEFAASREPRIDWRALPERAVWLVVKLVPAAAGVAALVMVNGIVLLLIASSEGVIPWLVTLGGLAWLNYVGVRRFLAWSATRHGPILSDLRYSLAAWLMPKNGAAAT
jgi:hypothetical protein